MTSASAGTVGVILCGVHGVAITDTYPIDIGKGDAMTRYMDADIRQQWVDALRSGKYEQGRRLLRDANGNYCCLGVLCDIFPSVVWERVEQGRWENWSQYDDPTPFEAVVTWRKEGPTRRGLTMLPMGLAANIGLLSEYHGNEPICGGNDDAFGSALSIHGHLIAMNDRGYSFDQIADWIERNVPTERG